MHHPQVVQSPIVNDCLKVNIDDHTEPQLFSKKLLQVSVREFHNIRVSETDYGGLKDERDEENNIIISDFLLRSKDNAMIVMMNVYFWHICNIRNHT